MKKIGNLDIILVTLLAIIGLIFILMPVLNDTFIRVILGILLVLFLPGYSFISFLFPEKEDLDGVERIALSFCLSISITPLITLLLNFTPLGINLIPILISISVFTILMSIITYIRRQRLSEKEKFTLEFNEHYNNLLNLFKTKSPLRQILLIILIISIILAVSMIAYSVIIPKGSETFTEFYLLGPKGTAADYPTNLTTGETGNVIIGVVNHEHQTTSYKIVIKSNDQKIDEANVTLKDEEKMELPYKFASNNTGRKKLEFLLYKMPDNINAYRTLILWVDIQ
jgi:uncharacterized membrane protein